MTAAAGLLLSGALVLAPWHAEARTGAVPAAARPSEPPPSVDLGLTKEGAKAKGSKKKQGRIETSRKGKPRPKPHVPARPPVSFPAVRPSSQKKEIRLNIGICGMPAPDGGGRMGPARCGDDEPVVPPVEPDEPTATAEARRQLPTPQDVSWEQVLTETKNVAFPGLRVRVQPTGRTLVNLDTIVYTDQAKVSTATVTLLDFPVVVEATPLSYTWTFGDGTSMTTTSPGKPHPAKDITHKYTKRGAVSVSLTTHYGARFNVAGTGWQYVNGTVPITGPATPLQVQEAVPVLVEPPN